MSEAFDATVSFDDAPRGAARADGAAARIAEALRGQMADAPDALYNEALTLAREGHLGQAVSRLQMLLCLDPDDADGLLLLSKVHAVQGRPSEALTRLDAAVAVGALAPAGLREQLETSIRAERVREEESRARVATRERGEVAALRNEARSLRSEAIRLEAEVTESRARESSWKIATIGASIFGIVVIVAITYVNGSATPPPPERNVAEAPAMDLSLDAAPGPGERTDGPAAPGSRTASALPPAALTPTSELPASIPVAAAPTKDAVAPAATTSAAPAAAVMVSTTSTPVAAPPKMGGAAAPVNTPAAPAAGSKVHVVVSGDTLQKIAGTYYGSVNQWEPIARANGLTATSMLKLGQKISVPPAPAAD
jgi:LysM repeat protein